MIWVAVDVVLVLVVLGVLAGCGWRMWQAAKALGREVSKVGEIMDAAAGGLEVVTPPPRPGTTP